MLQQDSQKLSDKEDFIVKYNHVYWYTVKNKDIKLFKLYENIVNT
jgi:hypothetical protein